jgi:hypothetical protein
MSLVARIVTGGVLALVSTAFSRTVFEICYRSGFYPERWLADLTTGLLSDAVAFWLLASFLSLAIWLVLEFSVKRFWRERTGGSKMSSQSDSERPPPKHISEFKNAEEIHNYMGDIISPNFPLPLRSPARVAADAKKLGNPTVQIFDSIDGKVDGVSVPEGTPAVVVDRSVRTDVKNITVRDRKAPEKP